MQDLALVINLGGSSLKVALVDDGGTAIQQSSRHLDEPASLEEVLQGWLEPLRERIELIAHRLVHGGDHFTEATLITTDLETSLQKLVPLAPLHNPSALQRLHWAGQDSGFPTGRSGPVLTWLSTRHCPPQQARMPCLQS